MADDDDFCARLSSAQSFVDGSPGNDADALPTDNGQRKRWSGERVFRWVSLVVAGMMGVGIGMVAWNHSDGLASSASDARKHSKSPIDFMMWVFGSEKTFNESFSDALKESQRKTQAQFGDMKSAYAGANLAPVDFKPFDASTLWPQSKPASGSQRTRSGSH